MQKIKGFHIRYHKVEGDLHGALSELVREKVFSVLNGCLDYTNNLIYYINIIIGDVIDAVNSDLC